MGNKVNILPVYTLVEESLQGGSKLKLATCTVAVISARHQIFLALPSRDSSRPPAPTQFRFPWFYLPSVNHGLKIFNGKFQNKQFISFKLPAVLSCVMKSNADPLGK